MKPTIFSRRLMPALILTMLLLISVLYGIVHAQTGGGYDLSWNTLDGGGNTTATGGVYSLGATIGQPDAGRQSGGIYSLDGGFWTEPMYRLYQPLILK